MYLFHSEDSQAGFYLLGATASDRGNRFIVGTTFDCESDCGFLRNIDERNSYELGGIYFSLNLLMTQVSVLVCLYLYFKYYDGEDKLDEKLTWAGAILLTMCWLFIFSSFLFKIIVPSYGELFGASKLDGKLLNLTSLTTLETMRHELLFSLPI